MKTYGNKWFRARAETIVRSYWNGKTTAITAYLRIRALGYSHEEAHVMTR